MSYLNLNKLYLYIRYLFKQYRKTIKFIYLSDFLTKDITYFNVENFINFNGAFE